MLNSYNSQTNELHHQSWGTRLLARITNFFSPEHYKQAIQSLEMRSIPTHEKQAIQSLEMLSGPSLFGATWNMHGNVEESVVNASVEGFIESDFLAIGLTAKQMKNLGTSYGECQVEVGDRIVPVAAYNVFGVNRRDFDSVFVSTALAAALGLQLGDRFTIRRNADEGGRLRFRCSNGSYGDITQFGKSWVPLCGAQFAIVCKIIDVGDHADLWRIGLSARQLTNLGLSASSIGMNAQDIASEVEKQRTGTFSRIEYEPISVSYSGKSLNVAVHNAFGEESIGGPGISISSALAEELSIQLGDHIYLNNLGIGSL